MHLGIIMDGNRRWARKMILPNPDLTGHTMGAEKVKDVVRWCVDRRIEVLSLFAFSAENWERDKKEVGFLMNLAEKFIAANIKKLHLQGARVRFCGRKHGLPGSLVEKIEMAEELTRANQRIIINIFFNYGGRAELVDAMKRIILEKVDLSQISETKIGSYLYTAGLPDPDLIIRTSGEQRISGFLLWQSAYSELHFTEKYWPDFSEKDLDDALKEYNRRKRRFGK